MCLYKNNNCQPCSSVYDYFYSNFGHGNEMSRSPAAIAENVIALMHQQNLNCTTIPWDKFYRLCERERIKEPFMEGLKRELKKRSFLLNEGHAVVTVTKDFNFAQLEF